MLLLEGQEVLGMSIQKGVWGLWELWSRERLLVSAEHGLLTDFPLAHKERAAIFGYWSLPLVGLPRRICGPA